MSHFFLPSPPFLRFSFLSFFHSDSSYLNLAELRHLQGQAEASHAYWKECVSTLFSLFLNGRDAGLLRKASPGFTLRVRLIFKRLVRLLLCYDPAFINKVRFPFAFFAILDSIHS